jgi:hypothetical protein
MDPITTALAAALPVLASELAKSSVKDAYHALKALIRRKWGEASPIAKSVDTLEANPKSKGQAVVLAENVAEVNATGDTEVMAAVARLMDELKKEGISGGNVQQGVFGSTNVSIGSMNINNSGGRRN